MFAKFSINFEEVAICSVGISQAFALKNIKE